jgi:predicted oxidoreductase
MAMISAVTDLTNSGASAGTTGGRVHVLVALLGTFTS